MYIGAYIPLRLFFFFFLDYSSLLYSYRHLHKESFLLSNDCISIQIFEKFSHNIVCIDSTHKTNPYRLKLVTIVVTEELKNGIENFILALLMHDVLSAHFWYSSCMGN